MFSFVSELRAEQSLKGMARSAACAASASAPTIDMQNSTIPKSSADGSPVVPLYPKAASSPYDLPELCPIPNGPAIAFLIDFLQAGGFIPESGRSHSVRYIKKENERHQLCVCRTSQNVRSPALRLSVDNEAFFDRLDGNNVWAERLLLYLLALRNLKGNPDEIGFPLSALVSAGLYSSNSNARRGLCAFFAFQAHISLEQADKNGVYHGGPLFTNCEIKSNYVILSCRPSVPLTDFFSFLPSFAFSLSSGAFVLLHYIFSRARQKTSQIAKTGGVNLSLRGISERMGLPSWDKVPNRKYRERIRLPIERAVGEINAAAAGFVSGNLTLKIQAPAGQIQAWLDGYLTVHMDGDYAETFEKIAASQKAKITRFTDAKEKEAAKIAARAESKKARSKTPDPVQSVS